MSYDISSSLQGQLTGASLAAGDRQRQWQQYQAEMEAEMKRLTYDGNTEIRIQRELKDRALEALGALDPNHPLLVQANRQRIAEEIEAERKKARP